MADMGTRRDNDRHEGGFFAAVGIAVGAVVFFVLQLWRADLRIPLEYSGDATWGLATVKGMIEHGWVWVNPSLGAPGALNSLDYPNADLLNFITLKAISLLTGNAAVTVNVFYLLGYPAVALAGLWAFRRLGLSRPVAAALGILYALLPYHLQRGEAHLFLSMYYVVPLAACLTIELMGARPPLVLRGRLALRRREAVLPLAIAAAAGMAGVYYAFFTGLFVLLAGVWGWWRTRERVRLLSAATLVGTLLVATMLAVSPFLWYRATAGPNPAPVDRNAGGLEVYGLKITQMLLPVRHHRVAKLANIREQYQQGLTVLFGAHMDNESDTAALGIVGAIGFVLLLLTLLFGTRSSGQDPPVSHVRSASVLGTIAVLLATSSGFCLFIGYFLPQIRAYNRIVVFVAFFALLAFGTATEWLLSRIKGAPAWLPWVLGCAVLVLGVADQTTGAMVPRYDVIGAEWRADEAFVSQVDSAISAGAPIFQLPVVPFPENPPVVGMVDYDHFKPYLHSSNARWSYGAVKGRESAIWQQQVSTLDSDGLVAALKDSGFAGVWIDRAGYEDDGEQVIDDMSVTTGGQPLLSPDGSYAYFELR